MKNVLRRIIFSLVLTLFPILIASAQWIQQISGTNQNLYDIEFIKKKPDGRLAMLVW